MITTLAGSALEAQHGPQLLASTASFTSLEQRLGLGVERLALCCLATHGNEALEVQGLAGRPQCIGPLLES